MHKPYKLLVLAIVLSLISSLAYSQEKISDTSITSLNADLLNIFNQKPKKYKVVSVNVIGNKYFDENILLSIANLNVGDEVTIPGGDDFAKAIKKLWAQNYFSNIEIYIVKLEENNIYLEVNVVERPRLSNYYFVGKGMHKSEIDDLTAKSGLVKGRIVTENMKLSAVEAIKKYYAEKSYQDVIVEIEEQKDSLVNNSLVLNFVIDKGNKVRVNNINLGGNNAVDDSKLKKRMKGTKEQSRLTLFPPKDGGGFLTPKRYTFDDYLRDQGYFTFSSTKELLHPYVRLNYFSSAKFNANKYIDDKDKLIEYYNSIGYRDASIVKDTLVRSAKGTLNIDIKINEGHKYYFGNITWKGNTKYSDSILTVILGIQKGDVYNLDLLNKRLGKGAPEGSDIGSLYMDNGYLFFRTEPVEKAVYNDTIDFEIRIVEGPQAIWKNIRITGNDKTKEYVIRRELRTLPGEKFSRADLIRSQRELAQLSFFNPEKINPNVVPNPEDGTVDVTWQVEEKSSDQLELSAGWGGTIGLTGTLGVTFNNFSAKNLFKRSAWEPLPMGDGQKLSLRAQSNGKLFRSYNFSFTEPWFGGKQRNTLSYSVYDTKYTSSATANSYIRTTGISVSLGKQLKWPDDYFTFSVGINYSIYQLNNYYINQVNLPGFNNGFAHNLNLKLALQRSSVDNPLYPRSGSNYLLSLQVTPPYSYLDKNIIYSANPYNWIEYHKWRFNGEWYVPIGPSHGDDHKQLVLKAAAKYGFLGRYNPQLQISPFERFQVGDAGLSNQFAMLGYDIIAQRGYPVYQTSDPKVNPELTTASQYFTIFNKYVLELRYPLTLASSSTIYGLAFFEAANGWYSIQDYNPFRLRRSTGLGVRFFLPMFGLLGFDYGLGLDRYTPGAKLKDISRFTFMLGFEPE